MTASPVALGFRAHTAWAAALVLAGPVSEPTVLDRRRVSLAGAGLGSPFVYHEAAQMTPAEAERHVQRARKAVGAAAEAALNGILADFPRVVGVGVILGNRALPEELATILRAHPLLHAAEGELYRKAIVQAAERKGLSVAGISSRDLRERGSDLFGEDIDEALADLRRRAGRPWGADQREAALAAWLALKSA